MGPCPLGPRRNRWAACASRQSVYDADWPSDYWFTAAQEKWFQVEPSTHISPFGFVGWLYLKHLLDVMTSSFWVRVP